MNPNIIDVFNGDADGICALHQLRLAEPAESGLVTGPKRDIGLLARVTAQAGDRVTVLDIALDIRKGSSTFGQHVATELSGENKRQLFIPRGFAHGFAALSDEAILQYKCDNYFAPGSEGGILWNDPALGIDWKLSAEDVILSEKDKKNKLLNELKLH